MTRTLTSNLQFKGERRQVTALFYDIVESTELLVRSDPESIYRSISSLHHKSETIVRKHGGVLQQRLGDGGCCYFGYPTQSEDAAERAVQASLELIDVVSRRRFGSFTAPFKLRVGVATSLVVFSADGKEIIGTAPVLAARLQAQAEPHSVLVADSTYQLTRTRFSYQLARNARLKGFASPIPIWRPLSQTRVLDQFSQGFGSDTPIRGRDQDLHHLAHEWRLACAGQGRSIAIIGDAGIGKSKLVSAFFRQLQRLHKHDFVMQCSKRLQNQPLHPFVDLLEAKVGRSVLQNGKPGDLQRALIAAGFDVDTASASAISDFTSEKGRSTSSNIRTDDMSGRRLRRMVIDAALRMICCSGQGSPKLVVVEDANFADSMTLELMDRLIDRLDELPFLVLLTSRDPVASAVHGRLFLKALDSAAIGDLVATIWGGVPPRGLADYILRHCDGTPLYAEELALFFRSRHTVAKTATGWTKMLSEGGVSSLNDLLSSKLAGLGQARRIAQFASVIGREFSVDLLASALNADSGQSLEPDLATLISHGVIERKTSPPDSYQFRHVLLQEAAYGSLLRADRRGIHKRIARLLDRETTTGLSAAVSAWHCAQAGWHLEAARFSVRAAEACVLRSAMVEAAQMLDLCAQELAATPQQPAREALKLDLLQLRGVVSIALDGEGSPQARRIYNRAISIIKQDPSASREDRFPLYWGWWFTASNLLTQQSRAHVLLEDMTAVGDPEILLQSYHCAWATSFHAAEHSFCLDCVQKGLELYDQERAVRNRAFFGGHDARVCGLGESALSYLLTNQLEQSEKAIMLCLEAAELSAHPGSIVHAYYYAIVLRRCQARYEEVYAIGKQMHALAEQSGLLASQARANMYCGWAAAMSSSAQAGAQRFDEGLMLHQQVGTDDNYSIHSDMQAEILQRMGRSAEALLLIDQAIKRGSKSGQWFWLPELFRRRAELRHYLGEPRSRVESDLWRAVQTADSQGAGWLLERAQRDLQRHSK